MSIPLQKDSESQVEGKVIPARFLKIQGRGCLLGQKTVEKGTDRRIGW